MVKYHPDVRFLTDYTAGCLPTAQALCVATHLHYCTPCKLKVRELTELGSILFMQQQRSAVKTEEFERLLDRLEKLQVSAVNGSDVNGTAVNGAAQNGSAPSASSLLTPAPPAPPAPTPQFTLPRSLHKLARGDIESLQWRRIGSSFRYSKLNISRPPGETTLYHIRAGGNVPHHRHEGDEITVVINGSFSDHDDKYGIGDFIVRTTGEQHRPVASQDEDCLCLSSLDKPIVISNWFYRLLAPLM
jgi:putative transcriptional regulator